jgi:hypothetical protein
VNLRIIKSKKQATNTEIRNYEARVNTLNFLIYQIRPDISNAVSIINQHNINPDQSHWNALKNIFAYLKKLSNKDIIFRKGNCKLIGYSDSD